MFLKEAVFKDADGMTHVVQGYQSDAVMEEETGAETETLTTIIAVCEKEGVTTGKEAVSTIFKNYQDSLSIDCPMCREHLTAIIHAAKALLMKDETTESEKARKRANGKKIPSDLESRVLAHIDWWDTLVDTLSERCQTNPPILVDAVNAALATRDTLKAVMVGKSSAGIARVHFPTDAVKEAVDLTKSLEADHQRREAEAEAASTKSEVDPNCGRTRFGWVTLMDDEDLQASLEDLRVASRRDQERKTAIRDELNRRWKEQGRLQCPLCKGYLRTLDSENKNPAPGELDGGIVQCCDCTIYDDIETAREAFKNERRC